VSHPREFSVGLQLRLRLEEVLKYLCDMEPIPLHWAVAHAEEFARAWATSRNPNDLLRIASRATPHAEYARAALAIAKAALPYAANAHAHEKAWIAIDIASRYAAGDTSVGIWDVRVAAEDASVAADGSFEDLISRHATRTASEAALVVSTTVGEELDEAIDTSIAAAGRTHETLSLPALADIVRAQLAHRDILADVVNANRG